MVWYRTPHTFISLFSIHPPPAHASVPPPRTPISIPIPIPIPVQALAGGTPGTRSGPVGGGGGRRRQARHAPFLLRLRNLRRRLEADTDRNLPLKAAFSWALARALLSGWWFDGFLIDGAGAFRSSAVTRCFARLIAVPFDKPSIGLWPGTLFGAIGRLFLFCRYYRWSCICNCFFCLGASKSIEERRGASKSMEQH